MVRWRKFFSSPSEIQPDVELFIKRVVFFCLHSNRYVWFEQPSPSITIQNVSYSVSILSREFAEHLQMILVDYPKGERSTMDSHMKFLHVKLKYLYESCRIVAEAIIAYFLVLCLGIEVIYIIRKEISHTRKKEFMYATVYMLSRVFSGREFTDQLSIRDMNTYANLLVLNRASAFIYVRNNPRRLRGHRPRIALNYLDDICRPIDNYSPDSPISSASWPDSGASVTTAASVGGTPAYTPPIPEVPSFPAVVERHRVRIPWIRRFIPRICRIRCLPRFLPRVPILSRFRRFYPAIPRLLYEM